MKKSPFITAYCIFVVLVFIGTLTFSGISLGLSYKKGVIDSKSKYDIYSMSVVESIKRNKTPEMDTILNGEKIGFKDFAFINVKLNGNDIYAYPQGKTEPGESNKYVKRYFDSYKIGENTVYTGAYVYLLSPAVIAYYCKISFIIILIFTIITILLIVYKGVSENDDDETEDDETETDGFDLDAFDSEKITEEETSTPELNDNNSEDEITITDTIETDKEEPLSIDEYEQAIQLPVNFDEIPSEIESETKVPYTTEEVIEEKTEECNEESNEEKTPVETEIVPETTNEAEVEAEINENNEKICPCDEVELPVNDYIPETKGPSGLYSDITGFGWESYLKPRLENELIRATSSEFDLCLFLIKVTGTERTSKEIEEIGKLLISYFQFKDMIFEYKDDCFAAIKTNMIIDDAIKMSDNLYCDIQEVLKETEIKCYIGITSKTIRMIGAERILKEAEAAVEHAQEDLECPITAFRADAEKYLEFVEKN